MWRVVFVLLFLGANAFAQSGPKRIDFTTVLKTPDDTPLLDCADEIPNPNDCKVIRPLTLGIAVYKALTMPEQGLTPEVSWKRGHLGYILYKDTDATLTAEDIATIKTQLAKRWGPAVTAQAFPLLDPAQK